MGLWRRRNHLRAHSYRLRLPSGDLTYHQRYILIHECVHLYQMCLHGSTDNTPYWFIEGIADAISSHVFDEHEKSVTLDVLDKGVTPNFLDDGLTALRHHPMTIREIDSAPGVNRGVAFVLVNFLRSTPQRNRQFHLWCDGIMKMPPGKANDPAIRAQRETAMEKYFGPLDKLEADFAEWWKARRNSFHYVEWGWEQDRNTFAAYGFAPGGKLSQMDVLLPPGEKRATIPGEWIMLPTRFRDDRQDRPRRCRAEYRRAARFQRRPGPGRGRHRSWRS